MLNQFTCSKCNSTNLAYRKYAGCTTPTIPHQDGRFEYLPSIYDEDDYIGVLHGFGCADCNTLIEHCGVPLQTEKDLIIYLSMDPADREQQQEDYDKLQSALSQLADKKDDEPDVGFSD